MARTTLSASHFSNEASAFECVERLLWPRGLVCPLCGDVDETKVGRLNARSKPSKTNPDGLTIHGLRKCYACRKKLTVRVGTIFEDSHLPLHMWLQAIHLMYGSKRAIGTRQAQRLLNCSMKTAWHLTHSIREIMKPDSITGGLSSLGGSSVTIEADETFVGAKAGRKLGRPRSRNRSLWRWSSVANRSVRSTSRTSAPQRTPTCCPRTRSASRH